MATQSARATDKGTGYAILFGVLAALSAAAMYVGATDLASSDVAAAGFGAAVVFGTLAVVAIHIYE